MSKAGRIKDSLRRIKPSASPRFHACDIQPFEEGRFFHCTVCGASWIREVLKKAVGDKPELFKWVRVNRRMRRDSYIAHRSRRKAEATRKRRVA